jgi:uncharacterized protein YkwD
VCSAGAVVGYAIGPHDPRGGPTVARFALILFLLAAAAAHGAETEAVATGIVERTNAFRKAEGRGAVARDDALARAALSFGRYLATTGRVGHGADGRRPWDRAAAAGYSPCIVAENLAYQYRSDGFPVAEPLVEAFMAGWKESAGHRKNLLDPDVTQTGVGVVRDAAGRYYAVQLFGRPRSAAVRFSVRNATTERLAYRTGDRGFSLAPGATRAHAVCRAPTLQLPSKPERTDPLRDGATYVLHADGVTVE